jgi:hypothetical protein
MSEANINYKCVYEAQGKLDAEMICAFLKSCGVPAIFSQESAGATYGLTVGPLGRAKIMVPEEQYEEALQILKDMEAGKYELPDENPENDGTLGESEE